MFDGVTEMTETESNENICRTTPRRSKRARANKQGGIHPTQIVVAHSNGVERRLLASMLRVRGCRIIELSNGMELLMHMADGFGGKEGVLLPDLVIADENLRSYSGIDILLHTRNSKLSIPFILLTREYDEVRAQRVRTARGATLLQLPLKLDDLFSIVDFFLQEQTCSDPSAA